VAVRSPVVSSSRTGVRAPLRTRSGAIAMLVILVAAVLAVGCGNGLGEARALDSQGDIEGAIAAYQKVLAGAPEDLDALTGAAVDLMTAGRFDEALLVQERIVTLDPNDAQIRIELGFNYLNHQNRPADAVRVLAQAADLEPSARNLTFLSQAEMGNGDSTGAEKTLHAAVATDKAYAHSYVVLIRLLRESGRSDEAESVVEQARENGVDVGALSADGV
jgi:pentatricopeptide repeat protein